MQQFGRAFGTILSEKKKLFHLVLCCGQRSAQYTYGQRYTYANNLQYNIEKKKKNARNGRIKTIVRINGALFLSFCFFPFIFHRIAYTTHTNNDSFLHNTLCAATKFKPASTHSFTWQPEPNALTLLLRSSSLAKRAFIIRIAPDNINARELITQSQKL